MVVVFTKGHTLAAIQDRLPVVVVLHTLEAILLILVHHRAHHHHPLQVLHPAHLGLGGNVLIHQHLADQSLILDLPEGQG